MIVDETANSPDIPPRPFDELLEAISLKTSLESIFASEVKNYEERESLSPVRKLIWDYFFHANYDNVGRNEETLIVELTRSSENHIASRMADYEQKKNDVIRQFASKKNLIEEHKNSIAGWTNSLWGLSGTGFFVFVIFMLTKSKPGIILIIGGFFCAPIFLISVILYRRKIKYLEDNIAQLEKQKQQEIEALKTEKEKEREDIHKQRDNALTSLRKKITSLRKMIPEMPEDEIIIDIFQKDSQRIKKYAMERMSLTVMEEPVDKFVPSDELPPFCEPAMLQYKIPEILNTIAPHHIEAMQRQKEGNDIYVVNYYKYIIPTQHQISVYSTFFNHIADNMYGEFTDSFYLQDIVAFSTMTQAQTISLRGKNILINNAMLVSIILSSGDKISFNIRNHDFRLAIARIDSEQKIIRLNTLQKELDEQLSENAQDIESIAIIKDLMTKITEIEERFIKVTEAEKKIDDNKSLEKIIKFLRKQLRDHKS